MSANPFVLAVPGGGHVEAVSCDERIAAVRRFGLRQCLAAMEQPGVQPAVRVAIQMRLRFLDRKARARS